MQEQQEEKGADPFVAVSKGMILDDKIEEMGRFLFGTGIQLLPAKGLVNRTNDPGKTVATFAAKEVGRFALGKQFFLGIVATTCLFLFDLSLHRHI